MNTVPPQNNTIPITISRLEKWGGQQVLREARNLVEQGLVLQAEYVPPYIKGTLLQNNREFKTRLRILRDGNVESDCPCYANRERGMICSHVIALGLWIASRSVDPERNKKIEAEQRQAQRLSNLDDSNFIKRAPYGSSGSIPAELNITLDPSWMDGIAQDAIPIEIHVKSGDRTASIDRVPPDTVLGLRKPDETLLFALEDIAGGRVPAHLILSRRDWIGILACRAGESFVDIDGNPMLVHDQKITSTIRLDLDESSGCLALSAKTVPPFLPPGDEPVYIMDTHTGWVYAADHFWQLSNVLPAPYQDVYEKPKMIPREEVLRFLQGEAPMLERKVDLETELTPDLFTVDPAKPDFLLAVKGSPASLAATLYATYGDIVLVANKPDKHENFAIPDPQDILRYTVRNPQAEQAALERLQSSKLVGETGDSLSPLVGSREVLTFLGATMPALHRAGWKVTLSGRIQPFAESLACATPVVHIHATDDERWFDVQFDFEDIEGASIKPADIHNAIRKGEASIQKDGRHILIDTTAIQELEDVFADCNAAQDAAPGCFRLPSVYAPYVESSLRALDGVETEAEPTWKQKARLSNRVYTQPARITLPAHLQDVLRPYQRDGVEWLYQLEQRGFCGLLADEMGLGKTLQTLTWLQLKRVSEHTVNTPALVVCPTSLVQNWIEEATRFAPAMKTCAISGSQRDELWDSAHEKDLIVISYALLRRDIEHCLQHKFAAVVLDEAQHIKNHKTRNAQAAKQIRATNRLVLTGTPVENSVSDIWSIMDFLMPGYLGDHQKFRLRYELPISHGGSEADVQQTKLRRKLHPFLLRRLKKDVAKDLPPKLERLAACELSPDQKIVYRELLAQSRRQINDLVATKGFAQARMQILATLLRLRQACCHLDLLKLSDLEAKQPSGKMDLFLELLDEAMDSGHRILVFSQFVSMLHIIRDTLQARDIPFCYLDGNTKDRMQQVHQFNSDRSIPLFLISLKAGGTGLNLTGADMVIHFDPWWNPAVENQATDRAYRIGQKRTVYSIKLITKNTIEEKVLAMQKRKQAVINATVEQAANTIPDSISWDDVQNLLSE